MTFDQRSRIHRETWFPGGPRIPKNPNCLKNGKKIIQNAKTQKCLEIWQNQQFAIQPEVSNPSGSVISTFFCRQNQPFFFVILNHFQTKMFKTEAHFFPVFSPKDSKAIVMQIECQKHHFPLLDISQTKRNKKSSICKNLQENWWGQTFQVEFQL